MNSSKTPSELLIHVIEKYSENCGHYFNELDKEILSDQNLMTRAIKKNSATYKFASEAIRSDRELAKIAIEADPMNIEFAAGGQRSDKKLVSLAIHKNPFTLRLADKSLWSDEKLISVAFGKYQIPSTDDSEKLEEFIDKLVDCHHIDQMEKGEERGIGANGAVAICFNKKELSPDSKQIFFAISFQAETIHLVVNMRKEDESWVPGEGYFKNEDGNEDFGECYRIDELMGDNEPIDEDEDESEDE